MGDNLVHLRGPIQFRLRGGKDHDAPRRIRIQIVSLRGRMSKDKSDEGHKSARSPRI